ncbi:MAG: hypothetical protein ACE5HW_07400, partial [Candidatus Methanofastidiosia archaeon]
GNITGTYSIDDNDEVNLITYSRNGIKEKFYDWYNVKTTLDFKKREQLSFSYINGKKIKIDGDFINLLFIGSGRSTYPDNVTIASATYLDIDKNDNIPEIRIYYNDTMGKYGYRVLSWWDLYNRPQLYPRETSGTYKKSEVEKFKDSENIYERIMYWIYKLGILEEFLEQYPPPGVF